MSEISNEIRKLFKKVLSGNATSEETKRLTHWLNQSPENQLEFTLFKRNWILNDQEFTPDLAAARRQVKLKIKKYERRQAAVLGRKRIMRGVAATLLVFIVIASGYWVKPIISFSSSKNEAILLDTIRCPRGMQHHVILADGSSVLLNAESILIYPKTFENKKFRKVQFKGEGYFNIVKNEDQAFIVELSQLKVKVKGTSFSLSSYDEEQSIEVYLNTGVVELARRGNMSLTMSPGQLATFNKKNQKIEIAEMASENYLSWTQGRLSFKDESLPKVVKRLERWFDVKIKITDEAIKASRFTATFQNKDIDYVLETLAFTSDVSYKVVEKIDPATGQKSKIIQLMKTP